MTFIAIGLEFNGQWTSMQNFGNRDNKIYALDPRNLRRTICVLDIEKKKTRTQGEKLRNTEKQRETSNGRDTRRYSGKSKDWTPLFDLISVLEVIQQCYTRMVYIAKCFTAYFSHFYLDVPGYTVSGFSAAATLSLTAKGPGIIWVQSNPLTKTSCVCVCACGLQITMNYLVEYKNLWLYNTQRS